MKTTQTILFLSLFLWPAVSTGHPHGLPASDDDGWRVHAGMGYPGLLFGGAGFKLRTHTEALLQIGYMAVPPILAWTSELGISQDLFRRKRFQLRSGVMVSTIQSAGFAYEGDDVQEQLLILNSARLGLRFRTNPDTRGRHQYYFDVDAGPAIAMCSGDHCPNGEMYLSMALGARMVLDWLSWR